jgi:hypothetical protein
MAVQGFSRLPQVSDRSTAAISAKGRFYGIHVRCPSGRGLLKTACAYRSLAVAAL